MKPGSNAPPHPRATQPMDNDLSSNSPVATQNPAAVPAFCLLSLLFFCLFFARLGNVPLFDLDEGLYISCARQMVLSGDVITPRLNCRLPDRPGETTVPFYEKPILVYWLAAGSMRAFGLTEWAARLPAAMAALLTAWTVLLAGIRWFGLRAGCLAALIYATCPLTIVDARDITPDGLLVLWFTGILLVFHALHIKTQQKTQQAGAHASLQSPVPTQSHAARLLLPAAFWVLCSLAVLTKGVIGLLLPWVVIGIYLLLDRFAVRLRLRDARHPSLRLLLRLHAAGDWWPTVRALRPVAGALLFLVLTLPWFVLIWRAGGRDGLNHTWFQEYIIRQHIGRFKGLDEVHNMPLPTYLVYFLIGFFPFATIVPAAFRLRIPGATDQGAAVSKPEDAASAFCSPHRFLLVWFWTVFVFFSLAAAKLPAYIAPAYPAAALLVGRWLDGVLAVGAPARAMRSLQRGAAGATITGLLLVLAAWIGPRFASHNAPLAPDVQRVILHLMLLLALGSATAWACFRFVRPSDRGLRAGLIAQTVMLTLLVAVGCTEGYAVVAHNILLPYQRAAIAARPDAERGVPVVFYNIVPRRPSMLYYGGYAPYEHKEPGLLPFLHDAIPANVPTVDVVTPRSSYEHLILPELAPAPFIKARLLANYGDQRSGWVLVQLELTPSRKRF
jgi:4-amino-4-deoxy-L-arabinose transferase-like glycosyltransferase